MAAAGKKNVNIGTRMLTTVDCHCGGEPARVVTGGMPHVPGKTMYEKRQYIMDNLDHIRKILLLEPRGYPCQNADIILPPTVEGAAFGFVVAEQNKIYPLMSGHNTICVATALLETGMIPMQPETEFTLEAPGGLVNIKAKCENGKALSISIENVPSFVEHIGVEVDVPEIGKVTVDVAYGGMWYCIVDAASVGLTLVPERGKDICRIGEMIKTACREQYPVNHPEFEYPGCDIMAFRGPPLENTDGHAQNAVVMSNGKLDWNRKETWTGMIDRSPCGTGTSAIMAQMWHKKELKVGEEFRHQSIVGSVFVGKILRETEINGRPAMVPEITGRAWITQYCQVVVDPSDPFPEGYTVGDIWA